MAGSPFNLAPRHCVRSSGLQALVAGALALLLIIVDSLLWNNDCGPAHLSLVLVGYVLAMAAIMVGGRAESEEVVDPVAPRMGLALGALAAIMPSLVISFYAGGLALGSVCVAYVALSLTRIATASRSSVHLLQVSLLVTAVVLLIWDTVAAATQGSAGFEIVSCVTLSLQLFSLHGLALRTPAKRVGAGILERCATAARLLVLTIPCPLFMVLVTFED